MRRGFAICTIGVYVSGVAACTGFSSSGPSVGSGGSASEDAGGAGGQGGSAGHVEAGDAGDSRDEPDASSGDSAEPIDAPLAECPTFEAPVQAGTISSDQLDEISGLVVSRSNPRVLWMHNDSGDAARFFAVRDDGADLGAYVLDGVLAEDWEDLAIGPGPEAGATYLYVGDIGDNPDNSVRRPHVVVYRVPEPAVDANQAPGSHRLLGAEALQLAYPSGDGPHNAETLLSDPISGDLFIVTKAAEDTGGVGESRVYRAAAPLSARDMNALTLVTTLRFGEAPLAGGVSATGGDVAVDGSVLIRTYSSAFIWHRNAGTSLADALSAPPCNVPLAAEPQGEAIAFAGESGYFSVSEGPGQPLYFAAKQ
jgi:hypothetical protein